MTRSIRTFGDPVLSQVAQPVAPGEDIAGLVDDMARVCRELNGIGLGAPQIGVLKRVAIITLNRRRPLVLVNPTIVTRSKAVATENEGCLSYPGIFAPVERHASVSVEHGLGDARRLQDFIYFDARVVQHELDHLDGICRVGDAWRARGSHPA